MSDKRVGFTQAALGFVLLALLLFGVPVAAETVVEEAEFDEPVVSVEPIEPLSEAELEDLVGPIALYPDDLIAIVLPASTYPLQIVQAVRFLAERENDESLQPSEDWDDSIIALMNYPEVLELMNDDLDWTWKLGEAVLIQQQEVIVAVSDFRERARVAGNLASDEHQVVEVTDEGAIQITPADPEVIYVPYYEPSRVTVYHEYPVYHYYPRAYPVYYYPYPADYAFSTGFFWGVTSAFSIGWNTHHLHLYHSGYQGHPYYGIRQYSYIDRYRHRTYNNYRYGDSYWRGRHGRHGASPRHRSRYYGHQQRRRSDGGDFDRHQRQSEYGQSEHRQGRRASGFDGRVDGKRNRPRAVASQTPSRQLRAQRGGVNGSRRSLTTSTAVAPAALPARQVNKANKSRVIARGSRKQTPNARAITRKRPTARSGNPGARVVAQRQQRHQQRSVAKRPSRPQRATQVPARSAKQFAAAPQHNRGATVRSGDANRARGNPPKGAKRRGESSRPQRATQVPARSAKRFAAAPQHNRGATVRSGDTNRARGNPPKGAKRRGESSRPRGRSSGKRMGIRRRG